MSPELKMRVQKYLASLEGLEYLKAFMSLSCAPSIAGIKAGTLLCFTPGHKQTDSLWSLYGLDVAKDLGLSALVLSKKEKALQVLLFREDAMCRTLAQEERKQLLQDLGYPPKASALQLLKLLQIKSRCGVGDEIACFLGYPVADIRGFMADAGASPIKRRYWCIYHAPDCAERYCQAIDRVRSQAALKLCAKAEKKSSNS